MATPRRFSSSSKRMTPAEMGVVYKASQERLKQEAADRRAAADAAARRRPRAERSRRARG